VHRITEAELTELKPGDKVVIRFFNPSGPDCDPVTKMTTESATVTRIDGDPHTVDYRSVWVKFDSNSYAELDYFGRDLNVPDSE